MSVKIRMTALPEVAMRAAEKRKPVNVTADVELVRRVRQEKGNLSALLEESMVAFLKRKELERWKDESRVSFESYDRMIEENGVLSDEIGLL